MLTLTHLAVTDERAALHCTLRRFDGRAVVVETSGTTLLNGKPIKGSAPLASGDRLRLEPSGIELLLIAARDPNGE